MKESKATTQAKGKMRVLLPDKCIDNEYTIYDEKTPYELFIELQRKEKYVIIYYDFGTQTAELFYRKK